MEYFIGKKTSDGNYYLFLLIGKSSKEYAEKVLKECEEKYPNEEFKICEEVSEKCWWNIYGTD